MTLRRFEWEQIRVQYVRGRENGQGIEWPSLEQLAEEHGLVPNTVRARAAREHWTELRHDYVTILQQESQERTLEQLADKVATCNVQVFNVASAGIRLLGQHLIRQSQEGELTPEEHQKIAGALAAYYRAVRAATGGGE